MTRRGCHIIIILMTFVVQICKIKCHKCTILIYEYMVSFFYHLLRYSGAHMYLEAKIDFKNLFRHNIPCISSVTNFNAFVFKLLCFGHGFAYSRFWQLVCCKGSGSFLICSLFICIIFLRCLLYSWRWQFFSWTNLAATFKRFIWFAIQVEPVRELLQERTY